jgi:DUF4097 and DUF4098 domain-containing protein YvlB
MIMKKLITTILLACLTASIFALPNLLKKEQFGADAINCLEFNLSSEDLKIEETYDVTSIDVEIYCNYKKIIPEVSVSGSTLYIDSANNGVNFFTNPTGYTCTVIVYVPQEKDFDEISIKSSSGEIELARPLSAKTEIKISASSGDIRSIKGLFADTVKVSSSSGEISLYNIDSDTLRVTSTSGDISIRKFTGGHGSLEATSGDIQAEDFASEYAEFKTSSGGITVIKLDCDYFDASNTSGGISLELKSAPSATSSLECSSGNINLYMPMRARFSVEAACSSGTFRDKFNNNRLNPREGYTMDYNGGGALIKLHTTSGDISLDY